MENTISNCCIDILNFLFRIIKCLKLVVDRIINSSHDYLRVVSGIIAISVGSFKPLTIQW